MAEAQLTSGGRDQTTADPASVPLAEIDVSDSRLYETDTWGPYFERLRNEDPVHWQPNSQFGGYWSITRFDDIKAVDSNHQAFSSERNIVIGDQPDGFALANFIAMDPPRHDAQRKAVTPTVGPRSLADMEAGIRSRVDTVLDALPEGEAFNWVDTVSIELTTQMLASLFDFPHADRAKLTHWSDCATASAEQTGSNLMSEDYRRAQLMECLECFNELWHQRKGGTGTDFVTMMANSDAYADMDPMEYLGNLVLLIVGGNDTTRNSMTGSVLAMNQFPDELRKLRADPSLIPNMVAECIRWQTPLAHMRRTALKDTLVGGKTIRKGDRVVMWYISGNRDERAFDYPNAVVVDRPNARSHVSFGFGIHRCMGNRLADLQLKVLWEELLQRFKSIEVVGTPERVCSNFVNGYADLPVIVRRR